MSDQVISTDTVYLALKNVHSGKPIYSASPLLNTGFLSAYMSEKGTAADWGSPKARQGALAELLRARIQAEMSRMDPSLAGARPVDAAARESRIELVSAAGKADKSIRPLAAAYLSTLEGARLQQRELAHLLGETTRTVHTDLKTAAGRLATILAEEEERARTRSVPSVRAPLVAGEGESPPYLEFEETERASRCLQALSAYVRSGRGTRPSRDDLATVRMTPPRDVNGFCLTRIAEWMAPSHQLDTRFVPLPLRLWRDRQGGVPGISPAMSTETLYPSMDEALVALDDRLIVVVGAPGAGKTMALGQLEWAAARAHVRGEVGPLPVYMQLSRFGRSSGRALAWLDAEWSHRQPRLPAFADLVRQGRLLLLLDGLNEMQHADAGEYSRLVAECKAASRQILAASPGNRIIISCRTMDYTTPLSSPDLRVPRLEIQPLDEEQIQQFLQAYAPNHAVALQAAIEQAPHNDALRVPYYLSLLVEHADDLGKLPTGRAGILSGFVRSRLKREVEADNRLFGPSPVLRERDRWRVTQIQKWRTAWELPELGALFPALCRLAVSLQQAQPPSGDAERELDYAEAIDVLGSVMPQVVLDIGKSLGILNDDPTRDAVTFSHQQMREYFTARTLAHTPAPALVQREWRATCQDPPLTHVLSRLHPAEQLPPLPQTGWEEPTILASEMVADGDRHVRGLMAANLSVAGACAVLLKSQSRLTEDVAAELRSALVHRSCDPEADLRDRVACAKSCAELGDPRCRRETGPWGAYILPPMVELAGGTYPIGEDEDIGALGGGVTGHKPRHSVRLDPFSIGKFPVTNAEFALFMASGGYDDPDWWDTPTARDWRAGKVAGAMMRDEDKDVAAYFRRHPETLDKLYGDGAMEKSLYEAWQRRLMLSAEEVEARLHELFPDRRLVEPYYWRNSRFNHPSQPIVGICWYEARAYCLWLTAQSGRHFRLPTEAEWEAAARGKAARLFAGGDTFDALAYNTDETHIRQPTPVGVFPDGNTPDGISDLSGNVWEWTSSAWGESDEEPAFPYPYDATDGREAADTSYRVRRVTRGGSMLNDAASARTAMRGVTSSGLRAPTNGMRLALTLPQYSPVAEQDSHGPHDGPT